MKTRIAWELLIAALALSRLLCGSAEGQLMRPERVAHLKSCFPKVDDAKIQAVLDDPELLLYTTDEMPGAYQIWDGLLRGVHWVGYNISADGGEPHGNANQEFPWGDPAGLHRTQGTAAFRFLLLPKRDGRRLPVVWYQKLRPGDAQPGYAWVFPVGTVFGEVLTLTGPGGVSYAFEVRTRTRVDGSWDVDAFRPFPTPETLADRIRQLAPDWERRPAVAACVRQLLGGTLRRVARLFDRHPRVTFSSQALVDELPPLEPQLVAKLLTETPFRSVLGSSWREAGDLIAAAPTTQAAFHIVPANYDAHFVVVDRDSCMRCHDQVAQHVDFFDGPRDWYGRVRGSDGIFSFHPFEPASLSRNGSSQPVQMRRALISAGLLEPFDRSRHPHELYHELRK